MPKAANASFQENLKGVPVPEEKLKLPKLFNGCSFCGCALNIKL